jgi:hypothetical protein
MTTLGSNLKLTIAEEYRPRVRALFVDVLGATIVEPVPGVEAYRLADGANVGVEYVAPGGPVFRVAPPPAERSAR